MRRHHLVFARLAAALALPSALVACTPAQPSGDAGAAKGAETKLLVTATRPPPDDPSSPFRNPAIEPPPPRSKEQLPADELAALIKAADEATDPTSATNILRGCANRIPPSPACEGRLGLLLAPQAPYLGEARFYLAETANADDPSLDGAFYQKVGDALMTQALFEPAAAAFQRALGRGAAGAQDYARLATALQGIADRQVDAAAALHQAYTLDPTQIEWLHDEAVLVGQIPDPAEKRRSVALFREYLGRIAGDAARTARVEARIAELEAEAVALTPPIPFEDKPQKSGKAAKTGGSAGH